MSPGGGRGSVGTAAAAFSGAPGEGQQERSPRAFVGGGVGAAATAAAAAGNHTGSAVPGCSSCCHDDDVTDATTGGGGCVCGAGRAVSSWGRGRGGKGKERGGRPSGTPRPRCFLPRPRARSEGGGKRKAGFAPGAGKRWLGQWARPPGRGAAEGAAERRCHGWARRGLREGETPGSFGRLGGIGRSCGARAHRPDRHFTTRREGGGTAETAFLQGKEIRPREEGAEAQISCRRGLAGGQAAERAGPDADAAGPS